MKIAFDTEFIDTPSASQLISIGFEREDGATLYLETQYDPANLTPWLREHVVPLLSDERVSMVSAARYIRDFVGESKYDPPEFWAYYGAYDWYWLCRIFGGMLNMPQSWPHLFREFAWYQRGVPDLFGPEHHALNDARSLMAAMRKQGLATAQGTQS